MLVIRASVTLDIFIGQRIRLKNWGFVALPRMPDSKGVRVRLASTDLAALSAGENLFTRSSAG
ncbi:hypothetical protein J6590_043160 [Homalodisca vitripennis]|nr:hypothetical protein J6590_043160 [Homalodisca vitripennis]